MSGIWSKALVTSTVVAAATVGGVAFVPPSSAAELTVGATADSYTRLDAPTTNFGSAVRLSAQGDARYARHALIRFGAVTVPLVMSSRRAA